MANGILFIVINDPLPVVWLVFGRGVYNKSYLVLYFDEQVLAVRLPLNKFYGVAHQFRQAVVVRKFPLAICNAPGKRCVFLDVPCNIDEPFYIPVVVPAANIFLEQALAHSCFKIIRKQKQQKMEQAYLVIGIGL